MLAALAGILVTILLLCPPYKGDPKGWNQPVKHAKASMVRVDLAYTGLACSGVVINNQIGYVLTAWHCVASVSNGYYLSVDGKAADVLYVNRPYDMAIVIAPVTDKQQLALRTDPVVPGLPVASLGFISDETRQPFVMYGKIGQAQHTGINRGHPAWLVTLDHVMVPGMSGGPTIDKEGKLVMLNQFTNQELSGGIGAETLAGLLEGYLP